ncbi:MAG: T9SS type A sorting domain-containing protein, partial [Bacteroidota bacterium]
MRTLTYLILCFIGVFLFLSFNSLHAQAPQTIIIVTDNGHGNGSGAYTSPRQFDRNPRDPKDPNVGCQPVVYIKGIPNHVNFNEMIAYMPSDTIDNLLAIRVEVSIDHPYVNGGMTHSATYQVANLNQIDAYTLEIPFNFRTGLPLGYPQANLMVINLEIYVRDIYTSPMTHWDGFQKEAWGNYTVELCTIGGTISQGGASHGRIGIDQSDAFAVSPNPFTDYVELNIPGSQETKPSVELFNLNGEKLKLDYQAKFAGANSWLGSLNTEGLTPGFYLIRVNNGTEVFNK